MKRSIYTDQKGFTDFVLFIVIIAGVLGLIAFAGSKVWVKNKEASQASASLAETPAVSSGSTNTSNPTDSGAPTNTPTTIVKKKGTAAAAIAAAPTPAASKPAVKEQIPVKTDQDLKTPQGSFYQLIQELKKKNYLNALYFISSNFLDNSAELFKLSGVSLDDCKANAACNVLLNTPLDSLNTTAVNDYIKSAGISGKSLVYEVQLPGNLYDGQASVGDGTYTVTVNMLDAATNWVVDSISVEGYSL